MVKIGLRMGKYLQDLFIYGPNLPLKGFSEENKRRYDEQYAHLRPVIHLLQTLYNYYLPRKYQTGHNLWRFIIHLEEQTTAEINELGHVVDAIQPFDNAYLKSLPPYEKKAYLLALVQGGIRAICQYYQCPVAPFEEVYQTIQAKGIQLLEVFHKPKWSPNRMYLAKLHLYQTEEVKEVSVLMEDKDGHLLRQITISQEDYWLFDEISWATNDRLRIGYINEIQSYKRKKVCEDYFEVGLNGSVKFVPATRELVFKHALTLLASGEDHFEEAIRLLKKAQGLGHGKADNVLANLARDPQERNLAKLTQAPKKNGAGANN